jgi:hypothetical protein
VVSAFFTGLTSVTDSLSSVVLDPSTPYLVTLGPLEDTVGTDEITVEPDEIDVAVPGAGAPDIPTFLATSSNGYSIVIGDGAAEMT